MQDADLIQYRYLNLIEKIKNLFHKGNTDIRRSEFMMLMHIEKFAKDQGSVTASDLSQHLHISNAAVSKTVGVLEKKGLVCRQMNAEDKRQAYLQVTEEGKLITEHMRHQANQFIVDSFEEFGKENSEALLKLAEQLYDIMSRKMEQQIHCCHEKKEEL